MLSKRTQIAQLLLIVFATLSFAVEAAHAQAIQSIRRASLAPGSNRQGESYSYDPNIDGNGRYVIFTSTADSFAADGKVTEQSHEHVYLRDVLSGETTQLDLTAEGRTGSPGAAFNTGIRVFHSSLHPHLSRDGKYAVFTSTESDISPDGQGEEYGNWAYLRNLETGITQRIPYATAGDPSKSEYPTYLAINGDGSKVIVTTIVSDVTDTTCATCVWELTLYDRGSNTTTLLNTGIAGNKFNPKLSDDGRYLVFENQTGDFSSATYSYLYDIQSSILTPLNDGAPALSPTISGDGVYVAFSDSSEVPTRIRLLERESGNEVLVSGGINGEEPDGISEFASLSIDGRYIAFLSTSTNLVEEDSNGTDDIFVFDRVSGKTTLVSVQGTCKGIDTTEDFNTGPPTISSDGRTIAFTVLERLIPADRKNSDGSVEKADSNSFDDVYVATLDYEAKPSVFKKGLTPASPFVSIDCSGARARVQIEDILAENAGATSKPHANANPIRKISQEVIITKSVNGRQQVRTRIVARRNTITAPRLPPGIYAAQVQARATFKNGATSTSKSSKAVRFVIAK